MFFKTATQYQLKDEPFIFLQLHENTVEHRMLLLFWTLKLHLYFTKWTQLKIKLQLTVLYTNRTNLMEMNTHLKY